MACALPCLQFIYEPIKTVIEAAMNDNKDKLFALLEKLEVGGRRRLYRCPYCCLPGRGAPTGGGRQAVGMRQDAARQPLRQPLAPPLP